MYLARPVIADRTVMWHLVLTKLVVVVRYQYPGLRLYVFP